MNTKILSYYCYSSLYNNRSRFNQLTMSFRPFDSCCPLNGQFILSTKLLNHSKPFIREIFYCRFQFLILKSWKSNKLWTFQLQYLFGLQKRTKISFYKPFAYIITSVLNYICYKYFKYPFLYFFYTVICVVLDVYSEFLTILPWTGFDRTVLV
jgi:hypothetical protein